MNKLKSTLSNVLIVLKLSKKTKDAPNFKSGSKVNRLLLGNQISESFRLPKTVD